MIDEQPINQSLGAYIKADTSQNKVDKYQVGIRKTPCWNKVDTMQE